MGLFYVWLPALLLVVLTVLGGLLVAWLVPLRGVDLWVRWVVISAILLLVPLIGRSLRRIGRHDSHNPDI
jgi:hypothetical protein